MNIEIKGEEVFIDGEKYVREHKPEVPKIEEGRLYYYYKNTENYESRYLRATRGKTLNLLAWDNIQPVHRRWDELSLSEKSDFTRDMHNLDSGQKKFYRAYKLITGEDHP